MRRVLTAGALALAISSLGACAAIDSFFAAKEPETDDLPAPSLEKIADSVWVHKSYGKAEGFGVVLSQGLVIAADNGVLLVDTAWNNADTETLIADIERTTGRRPDLAIVTHAHGDKMGGMDALIAGKIAARAHPLTNADAPSRGMTPAPMHILADNNYDTVLGEYSDGRETSQAVEIFYPGPGHSRDNIVVYYAPAKVLFGGCLIRPGRSGNLGNISDADVANWAAVRAVAARFPDAEIVVPSHGPAGGRELLDHTIALAEAANER